MRNGVIALVEASAVFGLVLWWGLSELRSLRRDRQRDEAGAKPPEAATDRKPPAA